MRTIQVKTNTIINQEVPDIWYEHKVRFNSDGTITILNTTAFNFIYLSWVAENNRQLWQSPDFLVASGFVELYQVPNPSLAIEIWADWIIDNQVLSINNTKGGQLLGTYLIRVNKDAYNNI